MQPDIIADNLRRAAARQTLPVHDWNDEPADAELRDALAGDDCDAHEVIRHAAAAWTAQPADDGLPQAVGEALRYLDSEPITHNAALWGAMLFGDFVSLPNYTEARDAYASVGGYVELADSICRFAETLDTEADRWVNADPERDYPIAYETLEAAAAWWAAYIIRHRHAPDPDTETAWARDYYRRAAE